MIIQGTNKSLTLKFKGVSEINTISVALWSKTGINNHLLIKKWSETDIISSTDAEGLTIRCPQTEEETVKYPVGACIIEVKWLDGTNVKFAKKINDTIIDWYDERILGD